MGKFRLRFLALFILSNILSVATNVGDLPQIIEKNLWFVDSLVLTLIEDLKNSKICSNSALQAAKCLNHVVSASRDAKAKANEIDAIQSCTFRERNRMLRQITSVSLTEKSCFIKKSPS